MSMNVKLRLKRYQPVALGFVLQAAPDALHSLLILLDGGLVLPVLEQLVALLLVVGLGLGGRGYGRGYGLLAVRSRVVFIAAPALVFVVCLRILLGAAGARAGVCSCEVGRIIVVVIIHSPL